MTTPLSQSQIKTASEIGTSYTAMDVGYFRPSSIARPKSIVADISMNHRFSPAALGATHDIPSLGSLLHVTNNGGLFLHISAQFHKMLMDEGLRWRNPSQDTVARNQEKIIGPFSRLCEYLSVLDQCLLGEGLHWQWYVVDHYRLYEKNDSGFYTPILPGANTGEHVLGIQQDAPSLKSAVVDANSVESIAKAFDELIGLASRNKEVDIISLIARFHKGCCCYQGFDWEGSILHLFSIAEVLANECWRRHVTKVDGDDAAIRAPLKNTKRLACQWAKRGSDWRPRAADLLLASLETSQIDQYLYDQLSTARRIRNVWIHEQLSPSLEDMETALDGVAAFVKKMLDVELVPPGGFSTGLGPFRLSEK